MSPDKTAMRIWKDDWRKIRKNLISVFLPLLPSLSPTPTVVVFIIPNLVPPPIAAVVTAGYLSPRSVLFNIFLDSSSSLSLSPKLDSDEELVVELPPPPPSYLSSSSVDLRLPPLHLFLPRLPHTIPGTISPTPGPPHLRWYQHRWMRTMTRTRKTIPGG